MTQYFYVDELFIGHSDWVSGCVTIDYMKSILFILFYNQTTLTEQ